MLNPEITVEQKAAAENAFYMQLGRCIAAWSWVELGLAQYFERISKMHPVTSRRIFYSGFGFDSRLKMLEGAMSHTKIEPDISPYLKKTIGKARNQAGSRNEILHGDVLTIGFNGSKYYGQNIILKGGTHWHADPPDEDVITVENLSIATENFGHLAKCVHLGLNWDGKDTARSPLKYLPLIDALPNLALRLRPDPKILAKFPIDAEDIPRGWR